MFLSARGRTKYRAWDNEAEVEIRGGWLCHGDWPAVNVGQWVKSQVSILDKCVRFIYRDDVPERGMKEDRQGRGGYLGPQACRDGVLPRMQCPRFCSLHNVSMCSVIVDVQRGQLTVVVVEDVCIADPDDGLSTWGISVSIGAVDEGAAAVNKGPAGFVEEWATRALRAPDTDTVSENCQYGTHNTSSDDSLTLALLRATCPGSDCNIFHG